MQRVTYKVALLTHKVQTTATPTYLSELVQTRAPPRALCSSDARRSSHTHRTGLSRFFCCCSIHLEHSTCWHSTVQKHSHFQMPLENPPKIKSVQHYKIYVVSFLSASVYFSKRGAYWDRLCRDVVGRWLSRSCTPCTVAKRCILGL